MIQVGSAWRLLDAPIPGATVVADPTGPGASNAKDPEVMKLIDELTTLDKEVPPTGKTALLAKHHLRRADILEKLVTKVKPEERDAWIRQIGDSLSTAAQSAGKADKTAMTRLTALETSLATSMPGSNLAAYVTFREMQADYSVKITDGNFNKVQTEWLERLGKFAQTYPKAEDTPDAILQLGMVSEFLGKDVEAKNWYAKLKKDFPEKPQAVKATGCGSSPGTRRPAVEADRYVVERCLCRV